MYNKGMSRLGGIWGLVSFYCGKDVLDVGEDGLTVSTHVCGEPLILENVMNKVIYQCPKCNNTISFYEVEKVVNKLSAMIVDETINGGEINLTNYVTKVIDKKTLATHTYRVLEHKNGKVRISLDDGKKR